MTININRQRRDNFHMISSTNFKHLTCVEMLKAVHASRMAEVVCSGGTAAGCVRSVRCGISIAIEIPESHAGDDALSCE